MALWGIQRQLQPLLNILIAPVGAMVYTDGSSWTWEIPNKEYSVIVEGNGK